MEQATSRSRRCTVDQLIQEQAGQTLEIYGRFQLNGSAAHQHQVSSIIVRESSAIQLAMCAQKV